MKLDGTIALFQYWNRLRAGRPAPKRTEIEPADIKSLLADTFILEKDARGEAVFRLAGTRLCATYGRELKGFAFASLWKEKDQRMVPRLAHGAFNAKSVVVISYHGISRNEPTVEFELVMLPLDGGLENPRCLGAAIAGEDRSGWAPIRSSNRRSTRFASSIPTASRCSSRAGRRSPFRRSRRARPRSPRAGSGRRIRHLIVLEGGREE